jgi:uncharacterized protein YcbK (DUF882 family)
MKWALVAIGMRLGLYGTSNDARSLSFYHTHTGKALSVVYYKNDANVPGALAAEDDYLADFRNGSEHNIDPALLDVLYDIKLKTGTHSPFEVISAYRSPQTNQMLRDTTIGVAKDSMHMRGQAIDVRLDDVPLAKLRGVALDLKRGVFTQTSAKKIAASLKRSAEHSSRRKTSAYRSALSMLTFYINRAGKTLPKTQRTRLERAKVELKRQFGNE